MYVELQELLVEMFCSCFNFMSSYDMSGSQIDNIFKLNAIKTCFFILLFQKEQINYRTLSVLSKYIN